MAFERVILFIANAQAVIKRMKYDCENQCLWGSETLPTGLRDKWRFPKETALTCPDQLDTQISKTTTGDTHVAYLV